MSVTKIGSFNLDKKIKQLRREKVQLPKILANDAKNHFVSGFRSGGGKTDDSIGGWKRRKFPRISPSGKISKSTTANILVKSGRLRRSVKVVKRNWNSIVVASNLPYSEIHNEGGHITQIVTAKQAAFFGHMGSALKKNGNTLLGNAYMRMGQANVLNIDIPKRQFIGRSKVLERKMRNTINREFLKILK
jgi:phage gpG-like protein